MGMAVILFNNAEPFEQSVNIASTEKPDVKSGENWSSGFREETVERLHGFIPVYSTGAKAHSPTFDPY